MKAIMPDERESIMSEDRVTEFKAKFEIRNQVHRDPTNTGIVTPQVHRDPTNTGIVTPHVHVFASFRFGEKVFEKEQWLCRVNFLEDPIQVSIKFYPHDYANWSEDLKEQANREVIAYVKAFHPGFVANQSRSVMMESLQKSRELVAKKRMELQRQEERYSELENFLFDTFSYDGAQWKCSGEGKDRQDLVQHLYERMVWYNGTMPPAERERLWKFITEPTPEEQIRFVGR